MKTPTNANDGENANKNENREQTCERNTRGRAKKKGRFWRRFAATVGVVLALGVGGAGYYWQRFWRPIDVDSATTNDLVGWLALRDLSVESPETRDRLFGKYFDAISTSEGGETTKIELPPQIKRFTGAFFSGRDEQIAAWNANRTRPPYWRVDYVVVPQTPRTSEFVLSSDVRPGPALLERWKKRRDEGEKEKKTKKSALALEKNVKLLVMQWFVAKYGEYDATPDAQKKTEIDRSAAELLRWQDFYNELRAAAKLPPASRTDLLKEFEATLESWNDFASAEEIAKALWFKDLLESVLASQENVVQKIAQNFGGGKNRQATRSQQATPARTEIAETKARSAVRDAFPPRVPNAISPSETDANRTAFGSASALVDAVRRFVFVENSQRANGVDGGSNRATETDANGR